jgi:hypothetical protein
MMKQEWSFMKYELPFSWAPILPPEGGVPLDGGTPPSGGSQEFCRTPFPHD